MTQKVVQVIRCFLCGILFPLSIYGQAPPTTFPFDHLTVDAGLSHNTVYALLEDHLGMIWMGTRFGLNQFDGYDFKVFLPKKGDPKSMNGHTVYCLWEDTKGNIWIGQKDAGISVFERKKGRFVSFPFTDDQTIDWETISVRTFFQDSRGHLWIGTFGGGAVVFDQEWNRIAHFCTYCKPEVRTLSNDFVFDFEEDQQGRIWIGTAGNGVSLYDPAKDSSFNLFDDRIEAKSGFGKSLCLDDQGFIWVGNAGNGLYSIDLERLEISQSFRQAERSAASLSHDMITDLAMDDKGEIWIAT
ncbi:MAG: two-component regulator propeller domain-containing protein, partial [Bacteroidia bacterium]